MTDSQTTVAQLRELVRQFVDERDWRQFHSPKNLAMALSVEAAELMEHFQWIDVAESRQLREDPERLAAAGEELADVFSYTLAMANALDLDLAAITERKMAANEAKYPAEEFRGRYGSRGRRTERTD